MSPDPILVPITIYLPIVTLLLIGFFAEQHYLSRLTVFSNSVALFSFVFSSSNYDVVVTLYVGAGLIAGVVAFGFYLLDKEMPVEYYEVTFYTYSSATVGLGIGLFYLGGANWFWLLIALVGGVFVNSKLLFVIQDRTVPIDSLPLPVEVTHHLVKTYEEVRRSF